MGDYLAEALEHSDYLRDMRRDFHRHPELGFQEYRTAGIVAKELSDLGLEVITGVAQTGVIGLLEGNQPGPVILLRFDMDALPIQEETGAEYASCNQGVMHACGHDGHTAIGLMVARLLQIHRQELAGTVKFVFQPAEEGLGGAKKMVEEGVLTSPKPDIALAMHLWNGERLGWLGISSGPLMASADKFYVRVVGKGGHGALPHLAVDPITAAAQMVMALQSIPARNVSPLESAVISIGSLHAGQAFNVIPAEVEFHGTIRTFDPDIRRSMLERVYQVLKGVAQASGCQVTFEDELLTPALINDSAVTDVVSRVAERILPQYFIETNYRTMVSEDMAYMLGELPGCYILIGSANPEKGWDAPHHHPRFDIDESVLPIAAALMATVAAEYLRL